MYSPTDAAARWRGAFVGSASGAVSIGAHALGGGAVSPDQSAVVLLIAACALVGVGVAAIRVRHGLVVLMTLLAIGQAVGHTALSLAPGHHHAPHAPAAMLAAHLIAIPAGALLIRAAEFALARAASSVRRTARALRAAPIADPRFAYATPTGVAPTPHRLLLSSGIGTRGPPRMR
ncbi:hypothetical protein [Nocardia australiensis]|uniref:hypothetical protein n=1 Tax=Nocardia australiensis TaxID=2887191 RepID=UPI001D132967|nr:hypothetical protein [Nocardia australiensis]